VKDRDAIREVTAKMKVLDPILNNGERACFFFIQLATSRLLPKIKKPIANKP
jgi:hypothetical protein